MYIKLNKKYAQLHAPTTQTQFHVARKLKPLVDGAYFPPMRRQEHFSPQQGKTFAAGEEIF